MGEVDSGDQLAHGHVDLAVLHLDGATAGKVGDFPAVEVFAVEQLGATASRCDAARAQRGDQKAGEHGFS